MSEHALCRLASADVAWTYREIPPLGVAAVFRAIDDAWYAWTKVCGITAKCWWPEEKYPHTDVIFLASHLAGRTIGYSQIPTAGDKRGTVQLEVIVDSSANWTAEKLTAVLTHEIGHVLGIGSHNDDPRSVMHGFLLPGQVLKEWEIGEAVKRYGHSRK